MLRSFRIALAISGLTVSIGCASVAHAPSPAYRAGIGALSAQVADSTGAVIPGATVNVSGPALQGKEILGVSDSSGDFSVPSLPPGVYTIVVTLSGFAPFRLENVQVPVGQLATVRVALRVGSVEEGIAVRAGQTPEVDYREELFIGSLRRAAFGGGTMAMPFRNRLTGWIPGLDESPPNSQSPALSGQTAYGRYSIWLADAMRVGETRSAVVRVFRSEHPGPLRAQGSSSSEGPRLSVSGGAYIAGEQRDFRIEEVSDQDQFVRREPQHTDWLFRITPVTAGKKTLLVYFRLYVETSDNRLPLDHLLLAQTITVIQNYPFVFREFVAQNWFKLLSLPLVLTLLQRFFPRTSSSCPCSRSLPVQTVVGRPLVRRRQYYSRR